MLSSAAWIDWVAFGGAVVVTMFVDRVLTGKNATVVSFREATVRSMLTITAALGFAAYVYSRMGSDKAVTYVVAYLVEEDRLCTAYGLMTMVQNIGLTLFNLVAGALNDLGNAGPGNPNGYRGMLWLFALLSLSGLVFSALLRRRETGPQGHGLETIRATGM